MKNDILIRPEKSTEFAAISELVLRSFREGTDYSDGTDVVMFMEEIRASKYYIPKLSFVAVLNQNIVGHFMFSHFPLSRTREGGHSDSAVSEIVMLAPVAVHADYFRRGIGTAMLTEGIKAACDKGYKGIIVEGNDRYYHRFGFQTSEDFGIYATSGFPLDNPRFMMCRETAKGSMAGIGGYVVYDMYKNA